MGRLARLPNSTASMWSLDESKEIWRMFRFPRGYTRSSLRMKEPDYLGSVEVHMQTYARCTVFEPCATAGVLKLLPRQQHIRSSPAISLLTRRMCICKRWVRLMTARKPPHTELAVTCFAQQQYHLAVSYLIVLHRYQPLVPPARLSHSAPGDYGGTNATRPLRESLWTSYGYGP